MSDNVIHVHSSEDYEKIKTESGSKLVVVDFSAEWCGPCRFIGPRFAALSNQHTDVVFVHIDIDKLSANPEVKGVRSVPTFMFFKNGSKISEFSGANEQSLVQTIESNK